MLKRDLYNAQATRHNSQLDRLCDLPYNELINWSPETGSYYGSERSRLVEDRWSLQVPMYKSAVHLWGQIEKKFSLDGIVSNTPRTPSFRHTQ